MALWIATNDGLNRFDGYSFKIYRNDRKQHYSIGSDIIKTVVYDSENRLWVGTDKCLSYYDALYDRFQNFYIAGTPPVEHIVPLDKERLLIHSKGQLWVFHTKTKKFTRSKSIPHVTTIYKHHDKVLIGSVSGLYACDTKTLKTTPIETKELYGKNIWTIAGYGSWVWLGTEGHGLYLYNMKSKSFKRFTKANSPLCSDFIRSLSIDPQKQIWIGTVNGLNIIDSSGVMSAYKSNPLETGSLSQASVRCIFSDRQGGMWVGTYFGGLNYYHPLKHQFSKISFIPGQNSINNNVIGCIVEDPNKNLWIGTNEGIDIYDIKSRKYEHITSRNGLQSNDIKVIYIDPHTGTAYIGSQLGGLGIMAQNSRQVKTVLTYEQYADANSIYAILPDNGGRDLLLGTLTGLKRFNKQTQNITPVKVTGKTQTKEQKKIRTMQRDAYNRLWVGTEGGLFVYSPIGNGLRQVFPSNTDHILNHAFIFCITQTTDGFLWIGSRQGVFKVNPKTWQIINYTVDHGLPSNIIYGILQDTSNNLWLSTGHGLCHFNSKTGQVVRSYTYEKGIQGNQFTPQAFCKTHDGRMLFGGVKGITVFYPDLLADNPYTPQTIITELRIFNNIVFPDDNYNVLKQQIAFTKRIVLSHSQSLFSLEFVVPNYIAGSHNTFAYMLEGYDRKWHYTDKNRTVSYSRLPHGTYTFKVKAANNDGKWNEEPTTLEIEVLPIWYNTWWARVMFILIAIALSIVGFRYAVSRKVMQMQLEQERQEKLRIQEVNEMKQRFFIDISHELRTPLTLISSPLQEMQERVSDPWAQRQFSVIRRNVNRLLRLVNQLMDYRRAELGVFKLQVARINLHEVVERQYSLFDRLATKEDIDYELNSSLQGEEVLCDPNFIELILNNLLSNAFKYTHAGQRITVKLSIEEKPTGQRQTLLQVADTGEGIPEDQQDKIFERFYQANSIRTGSGVGLSLVKQLVSLHHGVIKLESHPGKGTTFSVYLPSTEEAYRPEEFAKENIIKSYSENRSDLYFLEDALEIETEKTQEPVTTANTATLLIVEDNDDIRQHLADSLCEQYRIIEARNGVEAMEKLEAETVDLVITDVMMPEMDGLQLCKNIKSHIQTCHIPIIILSAKVEVQEQLSGLLTGADDYITKPFSISIIKAKIHNTLRIRELTIAHYTQTQQIIPKEIANNKLDEDLLNHAIDVVNKNMSNPDFTTEMFAREMLMSRSNLHIKLKALTGESANDFVKRIRFNKACSLIMERKYNISEICYMVGFNSPSYFSTSFKKHFGCTPSEYADSAEK